ncbi:MAG: hypothetical protein WC521_01100 [Bdellovibrionales bacterium]
MNTAGETNNPKGYEPDFALKKIIGVQVPLEDVFTPEKIAAGNRVIEISRESFFASAEEEIKKLSALVDAVASSEASVPIVATIASNIKGEVEIYGYPLIRKICAHIMETCRDEQNKAVRLALINDLTQALTYCIRNEIKDDGGKTGKALLADVSRFLTEEKAKKK